jgi:hypothetical protein
VVPLVLDVHVTPSGEVRILPREPTATNWVSHQDTPYMFTDEFRSVHVMRSVDE